MLRRLRIRKAPGQRGQSLAEFALLFPIMLVILCGIIELGRVMMTLNVVTGAAREGVRVAATSSSGFGDARAAAENTLESAGITEYSVSISGPDGNGDVRCVVNATHTVLTGSMVPGFSGQINISHTSYMRFEG